MSLPCDYPDIVISDVKMPQMDGITFARQFLEVHSDCKIIFMSAYLEIRYYQQAIYPGNEWDFKEPVFHA